MKKRIVSARCPKCGKALYMSGTPDYVYQCLECDEDFYEFEARYENTEARDKAMEDLWNELTDVPMNPETEKMDAPFLSFPIGTDREDIWHWFDERHSRGVSFLLYRKGN